MAIELYRKGIMELERGIAVDCWSGRGDVWDRAQRLHDKMQTNLSMARDRLHFLGEFSSLFKLDVALRGVLTICGAVCMSLILRTIVLQAQGENWIYRFCLLFPCSL